MKIFNLQCSTDKFKLLVKQHQQFDESPTCSIRALAFCETAWSLTDWIYSEFIDNLHQLTLGEFRAILYIKCPHLTIIHDLANASKHKIITRPKGNIKSADKVDGPFTNVFSSAFQQTILLIELENGSTIKVTDLVNGVLSFWLNYFKNDLKVPNKELRLKFDEYFDI